MLRLLLPGSAAMLLLAGLQARGDDSGERWLSGREQAEIHWAPGIGPVHLSPFQRLTTRLTIRVDGSEAAGSRGARQFVAWMELRDSTGASYTIHSEIGRTNVAKAPSVGALEYSADAFLVPGTYQVSLAVGEPSTGRHSLRRRTLRVSSVKNDPLPDAWRGLPHVELVNVPDVPERWFLPSVNYRLSVMIENLRPVRIEILLNTSISEESQSRQLLYNAAMEALLPLLKVLSEITPRNGSVNVTCIDLWKHQVGLEQEDVHELDWPRLKSALLQANPNMIDAEALKHHEESAQFFAAEVARRLAPPYPVRVAIVVSPSVEFTAGQEPASIHLQPDPDLHIFYIRLASIRMQAPFAALTPPVGRRAGEPAPIPGAPPGSSAATGDRWDAAEMPVSVTMTNDQLARALKPLEPRVFDVETPGEIRKALGAMLREIESFCR